MINVMLTQKELDYILEKLRVSSNQNLYHKFWAIKFRSIQEK